MTSELDRDIETYGPLQTASLAGLQANAAVEAKRNNKQVAEIFSYPHSLVDSYSCSLVVSYPHQQQLATLINSS